MSRTNANSKATKRTVLQVQCTPELSNRVYAYLFEKLGRKPMSAWVRSLIERELAKRALDGPSRGKVRIRSLIERELTKHGGNLS